MTIEWGAVCRAKQGQRVSGDVYLVEEYADGLGGGEEAERAARLAAQTLRQNPDAPLQDLIRRSHAALHSTRGAVIGLLRLELAAGQASYTGVGNIGAQVYSRRPIKPISKNGILGFRLPSLLELRYTYDPGDLFVLYSDGVSSHFAQDNKLDLRQTPRQLAEQVLAKYGKLTDDATVLVIRT